METINKLNQQNPEQYVLLTREFGAPIYIAPAKLSGVQITDRIGEAEKWSYADTLSVKADYHKSVTGYKGLIFERI